MSELRREIFITPDVQLSQPQLSQQSTVKSTICFLSKILSPKKVILWAPYATYWSKSILNFRRFSIKKLRELLLNVYYEVRFRKYIYTS